MLDIDCRYSKNVLKSYKIQLIWKDFIEVLIGTHTLSREALHSI